MARMVRGVVLDGEPVFALSFVPGQPMRVGSALAHAGAQRREARHAAAEHQHIGAVLHRRWRQRRCVAHTVATLVQGIDPAAFGQYPGLQSVLNLGTSTADNGMTFVALVEHQTYPFFGSQFHPEKNQFERGQATATLDKSTPTIQFLASVIIELAARVQATAKPLAQIPVSLQAYFAIYTTPIVTVYDAFERVYLLQRFLPTFQEKTPPMERSDL